MYDLTIVIPTIGRGTLTRAIHSVPDGVEIELAYDRKREGAGATRNRALQNVTTHYVGFLDDDDALDPQRYLDAFDLFRGTSFVDYLVHTMLSPVTGWTCPIPHSGFPLAFGNVGIALTAPTELVRSYEFDTVPESGEDHRLVQRWHDDGLVGMIYPTPSYYVRPA